MTSHAGPAPGCPPQAASRGGHSSARHGTARHRAPLGAEGTWGAPRPPQTPSRTPRCRRVAASPPPGSCQGPPSTKQAPGEHRPCRAVRSRDRATAPAGHCPAPPQGPAQPHGARTGRTEGDDAAPIAPQHTQTRLNLEQALRGPGCDTNTLFLGGQRMHGRKDPVQAAKNT